MTPAPPNELVERLHAEAGAADRDGFDGTASLLREAAAALEAALAREKGLREALLWISEYPNRTMEFDLSHEGIELAEFARDALTVHSPLEQSEAPSTTHSTLCALNATGHRG